MRTAVLKRPGAKLMVISTAGQGNDKPTRPAARPRARTTDVRRRGCSHRRRRAVAADARMVRGRRHRPDRRSGEGGEPGVMDHRDGARRPARSGPGRRVAPLPLQPVDRRRGPLAPGRRLAAVRRRARVQGRRGDLGRRRPRRRDLLDRRLLDQHRTARRMLDRARRQCDPARPRPRRGPSRAATPSASCRSTRGGPTSSRRSCRSAASACPRSRRPTRG